MPMMSIERMDRSPSSVHKLIAGHSAPHSERLQWHLNNPAALKQADYHYDQRGHQQDVKQPTGGVRGGHSQRPQDQQNYTDCPKHLFAPSRWMTASAGPKRRIELQGGLPADQRTAGPVAPLAQGAESACKPAVAAGQTSGSGKHIEFKGEATTEQT
jgi:hypothetical protein